MGWLLTLFVASIGAWFWFGGIHLLLFAGISATILARGLLR